MLKNEQCHNNIKMVTVTLTRMGGDDRGRALWFRSSFVSSVYHRDRDRPSPAPILVGVTETVLNLSDAVHSKAHNNQSWKHDLKLKGETVSVTGDHYHGDGRSVIRSADGQWWTFTIMSEDVWNWTRTKPLTWRSKFGTMVKKRSKFGKCRNFPGVIPSGPLGLLQSRTCVVYS